MTSGCSNSDSDEDILQSAINLYWSDDPSVDVFSYDFDDLEYEEDCTSSLCTTTTSNRGRVEEERYLYPHYSPEELKLRLTSEESSSVFPEVEYVRPNCVVLSYFTGDAKKMVDDHFARSLCMQNAKVNPSTNVSEEHSCYKDSISQDNLFESSCGMFSCLLAPRRSTKTETAEGYEIQNTTQLIALDDSNSDDSGNCSPVFDGDMLKYSFQAHDDSSPDTESNQSASIDDAYVEELLESLLPSASKISKQREANQLVEKSSVPVNFAFTLESDSIGIDPVQSSHSSLSEVSKISRSVGLSGLRMFHV